MRNLFRAVFAAAALAMAAPAMAQDAEHESQVRGYLQYDMSIHSSLGYRRDAGIRDLVAPLRLDAPYLWAVNLRAGESYRVYGVCDDNCGDLDMEIYAHDGVLVDRDVAANDRPYVQITPARSGLHHVRIWLYSCDAEPCLVAARVVFGGTQVERAVDAADDAVDADEVYTATVVAELDAMTLEQEAAGFTRFGDDIVTAIPLAGEHRMTVNLERRVRYTFVGACDQDCSDVNMEVLDARGRRVAIDRAANDRPRVSISPGSDGVFVVRTWLAQCSIVPCFIGVRGFRR